MIRQMCIAQKVLLLVSITISSSYGQERTEVYIGVLVDSSRQDIYPMYSAVIQMALENSNRQMGNVKLALHSLIRPYNSSCKTSSAPVIAAEMYHKHNISAVLGNFCDVGLDHVAHLAALWNIPVITGAGANCRFKDKVKFKTLTRISIGHCQFVDVLHAFLQTYSWLSVTIISDTTDIRYNNAGKSIHTGLMEKDYYSQLLAYASDEDAKHRNLLRDASQTSRVIIIMARLAEVETFLKAAWDLGYTQSGEYVFLHLDLDTFPETNKTILKNLNEREHGLEMYDALLRIEPDFEGRDNLARFRDELAKRLMHSSAENLNGKDSFAALAMSDAISIYGAALTQSFQDGFDYHDGYAMCHKYIWGKYYDGITGEIAIDGNGNRKMNFSLNDLNMETARFEPVAYYYQNNPGYSPLENTSIHWPGPSNTTAPSNVPKCWYNNDNPDCNKNRTYIPSIVGYGALIVSVLILVCIIMLMIAHIWRRFVVRYGSINV